MAQNANELQEERGKRAGKKKNDTHGHQTATTYNHHHLPHQVYVKCPQTA